MITRVSIKEISVPLRFEVWSKGSFVLSYEQALALPLTTDLRVCARHLGVPVETAAYLALKPLVEAELGQRTPFTVTVVPAIPLRGLVAT